MPEVHALVNAVAHPHTSHPRDQTESESSLARDVHEAAKAFTNPQIARLVGLRENIERILSEGDLHLHSVKKRVCPFRVFKRETAAQHKREFPHMSTQERQMIVQSEWKNMPDKVKEKFVIQARYEELEKVQLNAQDFFTRRVLAAKAEAPLGDIRRLLHQAATALHIPSPFAGGTSTALSSFYSHARDTGSYSHKDQLFSGAIEQDEGVFYQESSLENDHPAAETRLSPQAST